MTVSSVNIGTGVILVAGATVTITVPAGGVPANSNIYVLVTEFEVLGAISTNGTVSDTAGNTYTELTGGVNDAEGDRFQIFEVHGASALTVGNTIVYHLTSATNLAAISAFYATGLVTAISAYDSATKSVVTFNNANPAANQSGTPSIAGELFIAMAGWVSNLSSAGYALDTSNGWTKPPPTLVEGNATAFPGFFYGVAGGLQVNATTAKLTTTPTFSYTTNIQGATIVIGLKPLVPAKPIFFPTKIRLRR